MSDVAAASLELSGAADSTATERRWERPGPGSWSLDGEHCQRPKSRWVQDGFAALYSQGFRRGMARSGALLDTLELAFVNGFAYISPRPLGAPAEATARPPRVLFWLLTRLHPALRRRVRRAAEVFRARLWREDVREFFEVLWPRYLERFERLGAVPLEELSDADLAGHLGELRSMVHEQLADHFFRSAIPMVPVGDFLVHAMEWTGCACEEALALLDGHSPYSREATAELETAAGCLRSDEEARALLDAGADDAATLERLRTRPGAAGAAIERWLSRVGQRLVTGHDVSGLRGIEMPEVLVRSLRAQLDRRPAEERRARVDQATRCLRERVPAEHREDFDALLEEARLVHPLRDAHALVDFWGLGVARRGLLEAGRRLHQRGRLHAVEHVVDLEGAEIASLLAGGAGPGADETAAWATWREMATAGDAPELLGPPPAEPPPPDWLPAPAARLARATSLYRDSMFSNVGPPPAGPAVRGVGASPGAYIGTARLVLAAGDFARVREGDVLIARITSPTYNLLLPLLGALVTDRGGLLSHPAIVAREYGIPGVVGTKDATGRIPDGARVRVDGSAGTVEVLP